VRKSYKTKKKYKQGTFVPKNGSKFIGSNARYRSGLELKFMKFCDNNPNIIKWGSENVVVKYVSPLDNKIHRYYIDNYIEIVEGNTIKKYLIEIKPSRQCKPPTARYKKKSNMVYEQKQWVVNREKWKAATAYARSEGFVFKIITEKEIQ